MKVVLKLGKFLFPSYPNLKLLKEYVAIIEDLAERGSRVVIVTGGGGLAKEYIKAAREGGLNESLCDLIGIKISRINAYLLASMFKEHAYQRIPENLEELRYAMQAWRIVVLGGLTPGHSTTTVGALAAEAIKADCYIIASDVEGIYNKDPRTFKDAKMLKTITTKKVFKIAIRGNLWAGGYEIDPLAIKIIERSKIPTYFIDGRKPENFLKILTGEKIGTYIKPS